jgi:cytochrome bd-type quinol oxidase subunit 2
MRRAGSRLSAKRHADSSVAVQKVSTAMGAQQINRASSAALILFSLTALLTVATGLIWPPPMPEPDEGTQAHIFQLSIAALLPIVIVVLCSADWRRPWRSVRPLIISAVFTMLAFAGLYYLEHVR